MAQRNFKIFQVSDSEVIKNISSIVQKLNLTGKTTFNINLGQNTTPLSLPSLENIENNESLRDLLQANKSIIQNISININEEPRTINNFSFTRSDQPYDTFAVDFRNCPFERSFVVLNVIQSSFTIYDPAIELDKRLGPELADFYRKREQGLLRLENLSQKLIEQNERYRKKIDEDLLNEKTKLNEKYDDLKKDLQTKIDKQKESLDAREKDLDDRKNTHVRRQLRSDIKKELKNRSERFNLTRTTIQKRFPIHILFTILLCSILLLIVLTILGLNLPFMDNNSKYIDLYYHIRLPLLGASLVVTLIFYIRWIDRWAQAHADEEFRLKRLDLDIDRASWIVEMAMEWQAENKTEISKDLLDKLSGNLFSENESTGITKHPYEEIIRMLLSVSAEAKIPIPGGGELRIDKQGMKNLSKK